MDQANEVPCTNLALPPWSEEAGRRLRTIARLPGVKRMAVMPDAHLTEIGINGLVVATEGVIYPALIGNDPGCGYSVLLLRNYGPDREFLRYLADRIDWSAKLKSIQQTVPILKHTRPLSETMLPSPYLAHPRLNDISLKDARIQLGTLGRGNHFLELLYDLKGYGFWLVVHSGSRGIGQQLMKAYLPENPADHLKYGIEVDSPLFHSFMYDLQWARDYARASRHQMLKSVSHILELLHVAEFLVVESDHNHLQEEFIDVTSYWIHRKSVTEAVDTKLRLLPSNMAEGCTTFRAKPNAKLLNSVAHGCGRVYSRKEARKKLTGRDLIQEMGSVAFPHKKASQWRDEAPGAYRPIRQILKAHKKHIKVQDTLKPLLNYKG